MSWRRTAFVVGGVVRERGDFQCADFGGHVLAVHEHAVVGDVQRQLGGDGGELIGLGPIDAAPFARQGDGPVHGARVQEAKAQPTGQAAGGARFSGAGGAVDGDDHGKERGARNEEFGSEPAVLAAGGALDGGSSASLRYRGGWGCVQLEMGGIGVGGIGVPDASHRGVRAGSRDPPRLYIRGAAIRMESREKVRRRARFGRFWEVVVRRAAGRDRVLGISISGASGVKFDFRRATSIDLLVENRGAADLARLASRLSRRSSFLRFGELVGGRQLRLRSAHARSARAARARGIGTEASSMAKGNAVWGIDIGQCALKALRCRPHEKEPRRLVVEAFDYIEYPKILTQPEAEPAELIREALETFLSRNDLTGDTVAMSVSGQSGLARFIKLPPVESKKIPDIVKYEARQQIPFSLDDVVWDYQQLTGGSEEDGFALEPEVGLFAMKRDQVARALAPLEDGGDRGRSDPARAAGGVQLRVLRPAGGSEDPAVRPREAAGVDGCDFGGHGHDGPGRDQRLPRMAAEYSRSAATTLRGRCRRS